MIIPVVLCLLCFSSVRSDSSMSMNMVKDMSVNKMPMMETAKEKRYLGHHHDGVPCPPFYHSLHSPSSHLSKNIITPTYQNYHMPSYIHRPIYPQPWQPMYNHQPAIQHKIWQAPVYHQPMHQPVWQPKVIVQKPTYSYAPMYHHQPIQPHYSSPHYTQSLVKYQQPLVYQKPTVLYKPCDPMPCKPVMPSYHYLKPDIKYVHPQPQVSYIKVPPIVHHPMPAYYHPQPPVHLHKISHGVKEICLK